MKQTIKKIITWLFFKVCIERNLRPNWSLYHENIGGDIGGKELMSDKEFIQWVMKRNNTYYDYIYEVTMR